MKITIEETKYARWQSCPHTRVEGHSSLVLPKASYVVSPYTFRHAIAAREKAHRQSVAEQRWDAEAGEDSSGHPLYRLCGAASAQQGPAAMKRTVGGCYCRRNCPGPTCRLRGQRTAQAARARTGTVGRRCRGKAESAMRSHPQLCDRV